MNIVDNLADAERMLNDPGGRVIIALTRQEVDHLLTYRRFDQREERLDDSFPQTGIYNLLFDSIELGKNRLENKKEK